MILAGFGVLSLGYIEILLMIFVDRKKLDIPAKILGFWLVFQTILLYSPFPFSRRFILGIIIPLAVFFTFFLIRLWRRGIPSKICATILLLAVPLTFVYQTAANAGKFAARDSRYFYGKSATEAYSAMSSLKQNDVVMGSLEESNCIMRFCPAQTAIVKLKAEQVRGSFAIAQYYEKSHKWAGAVVYYNDVLQLDANSSLAAPARQRIDVLKPKLTTPPAK